MAEVARAPEPAPAPPTGDDGEPLETVEQTYTVEVSGRRFDVNVIGPPFARRGRRERRGGRRGGGKKPKRSERKARRRRGGADLLDSPLQGNMWKVVVEQGQTVEEGQLLCIIEAMKMENEITAHKAGVIAELPIKEGAADPGRRPDRADRVGGARPSSARGALASGHDRRTARLGRRRRRGRDRRAAARRLPRPPRARLAERQRVPRRRRQADRGPQHRVRHRRAGRRTRRPPASSSLRYRHSIWTASDDCLLEDVFVEERARGTGLGPRARRVRARPRARARLPPRRARRQRGQRSRR